MHTWAGNGLGRSRSLTWHPHRDSFRTLHPLEPALEAMHIAFYISLATLKSVVIRTVCGVPSRAFPLGTNWLLELGHGQRLLAQLRPFTGPQGHAGDSGKGLVPSAHSSEIPQGGMTVYRPQAPFPPGAARSGRIQPLGIHLVPGALLSQEPIFTFIDEGMGRGKKREMGETGE